MIGSPHPQLLPQQDAFAPPEAARSAASPYFRWMTSLNPVSLTLHAPYIRSCEYETSVSAIDYICQHEYTGRMDKRLSTLETLFKALADTTRLRILGLLLDGEVCVCDIHESLALPQPKISRHLAYLRRAGLVDGRRDGLWVHYRLARMTDPVMQALVDAVGHAIGHLDAGARDRRRLAARIDLPAKRTLPMAGRSCCGR